MANSGSDTALAIATMTVASVIWLPSLHFLFRPSPKQHHSESGLTPMAQQLAARHLDLWENPDARQRAPFLLCGSGPPGHKAFKRRGAHSPSELT